MAKPTMTATGQTLLAVTNLHAGWGKHRLYSDLDVSVNAGEIVKIAGANGTGKTTLLRQLCGLIEAPCAHFYWHNEGCQPRELIDEISYCGHKNGIDSRLSVFDNLNLIKQLFNSTDSTEQLYLMAESIGLGDHVDVAVSKLSAGQQKQLSLSRLLIAKRCLWLVDEPFSALDSIAIERWAQRFTEHIEQGGSIVLTSHQALPFTLSQQIDLGG